MLSDLGQTVSADLSAAMNEGDANVAVLTGYGVTGASAWVLITDTPGGALLPLRESIRLVIAQSSDGFTLSWLANTGDWQLQESPTPGGDWARVSPPPQSVDGRQVVSVTAGAGVRFFRLWGAQAVTPVAVRPLAGEEAAGVTAGKAEQFHALQVYERLNW